MFLFSHCGNLSKGQIISGKKARGVSLCCVPSATSFPRLRTQSGDDLSLDPTETRQTRVWQFSEPPALSSLRCLRKTPFRLRESSCRATRHARRTVFSRTGSASCLLSTVRRPVRGFPPADTSRIHRTCTAACQFYKLPPLAHVNCSRCEVPLDHCQSSHTPPALSHCSFGASVLCVRSWEHQPNVKKKNRHPGSPQQVRQPNREQSVMRPHAKRRQQNADKRHKVKSGHQHVDATAESDPKINCDRKPFQSKRGAQPRAI